MAAEVSGGGGARSPAAWLTQRGHRLCQVLRFISPPARGERPLRTTVPAVLALLVPPAALPLDDLSALAVQLATGHSIPLVEVEVRRPPQGPWEVVAEIAEPAPAVAPADEAPSRAS